MTVRVGEQTLFLHKSSDVQAMQQHDRQPEALRRAALKNNLATERRERRQCAAGCWIDRQPVDIVKQLSTTRADRPIKLPLNSVDESLWGSGHQLFVGNTTKVSTNRWRVEREREGGWGRFKNRSSISILLFTFLFCFWLFLLTRFSHYS